MGFSLLTTGSDSDSTRSDSRSGRLKSSSLSILEISCFTFDIGVVVGVVDVVVVVALCFGGGGNIAVDLSELAAAPATRCVSANKSAFLAELGNDTPRADKNSFNSGTVYRCN